MPRGAGGQWLRHRTWRLLRRQGGGTFLARKMEFTLESVEGSTAARQIPCGARAAIKVTALGATAATRQRTTIIANAPASAARANHLFSRFPVIFQRVRRTPTRRIHQMDDSR